jgi:hypothetical protein
MDAWGLISRANRDQLTQKKLQQGWNEAPTLALHISSNSAFF